MAETRGVRKVSERITQEGRTLIIYDDSNIEWSTIPDGTLKIDPINGNQWVKIKGQSTWIPNNIKNDGTISIAKDNIIIEETFIVKNLDDGDGNFTYLNSEGHERHMPRLGNGGFVFELEKGSYILGRNFLEVYIDDLLRRSASSGGIQEYSEDKFVVLEDLQVDQEITARYQRVVRIGAPYPRIFVQEDEPEAAENGDLWIDLDETVDEDVIWNIDESDIDSDTTIENTNIRYYEMMFSPNAAVNFKFNNPIRCSMRFLILDEEPMSRTYNQWIDGYKKFSIAYTDEAIRVTNLDGNRYRVRAIVQIFNAYSEKEVLVTPGVLSKLTIEDFFLTDTRVLILDQEEANDTYGLYKVDTDNDVVVLYRDNGITLFNKTTTTQKVKIVSSVIGNPTVSNVTAAANATTFVSIPEQFSQNVKIYVIDDTVNSTTGSNFSDNYDLYYATYENNGMYLTCTVSNDLILKVVYGNRDTVETEVTEEG